MFKKSKMKICQRCKKRFGEKDNFCNICGGALEEKEHQTKKDHSHSLRKLIVGGGVAVILLFIAFIPLPYTGTEVYQEKVPYEAKEDYEAKELVPAQSWSEVDYEYEVTYDEPRWTVVEENKGFFRQNVYLKNNEGEEGCWTLRLDLYKNNILIDDSATYFERCVQPRQTDKLETGHPGGSKPNIERDLSLRMKLKVLQAPQKRETSQYLTEENVVKTRTVTKYKDEEKTRTVTKYASLLSRWLGLIS